MFTTNVQQLSNMFIRPQRYKYKLSDLGAAQFQLAEKMVYRIDVDLKNINSLNLKCSVYSTFKSISSIQKVIVYLHCNSGCRLQGLTYLKNAIVEDYGLVVFDFAGSGISEGDYVSLGTSIFKNRKGFYESQDVECVIKYLRSQNSKMVICLWGRSMGAVAALRYLKRDPNIRVAVFDSPFSSLRQLALEIGKQQTNLPKILVQLFLEYLKPTIKDKAKFNIDDLNLKIDIDKIKVAGIFLGSKNDKLVPLAQVELLFENYKERKELFLIEEDHNETRKKQTLEKVFASVNKQMKFHNKQEELFNYRNNILKCSQNENFVKRKLELTSKSISSKNILTFKSLNSLNPLNTTNSIKLEKIDRDEQKNSCEPTPPLRMGPKIFVKQLIATSKKPVKNHKSTQKQNFQPSVPPASKPNLNHTIINKNLSSPKFHSKSIKNEIMKIGNTNALIPSGCQIFNQKIKYRKYHEQNDSQHRQKKQILKDRHMLNTTSIDLNSNRFQSKNRRTIHHLLSKLNESQEVVTLTSNEDKKFKRISFTKAKPISSKFHGTPKEQIHYQHHHH